MRRRPVWSGAGEWSSDLCVSGALARRRPAAASGASGCGVRGGVRCPRRTGVQSCRRKSVASGAVRAETRGSGAAPLPAGAPLT